MNLLKPA
jgi:hypothetical protein